MKMNIKSGVKIRSAKTVSLLFVLIGLIALVAGCGSDGNTLFREAAPENSALMMYKYGYTSDGSDTLGGIKYSMYTATTEKEFLAELSNITVKEVDDWSPDKLEYPLYGMWIGTSTGESLNVAWTGDYLITEDGKTYKHDFDIEELISRYEWRDTSTFSNATFFPCSRALSLGTDGWNTSLLKEVIDLSAPDGIEMTLVNREDSTFTIKLTNNTDEDWCYGTYFSVQALIDETWYDIPTIPGNWAFPDIAIMLMPKASVEETYNIGMYGDLPAGTYRLEVEDMTIAFIVE